MIFWVFQNNVLFANVIVVSLSSGQVNRIVVCGFSKCTSNYLKGIALSKLLVQLKSPQHAIKVQILSSSTFASEEILPISVARGQRNVGRTRN